MWTKTIGGNADDADREPTLACAPPLAVVATVNNISVLPKTLPDPPIRFVLLGRNIWKPPQRAAQGEMAPRSATQWP